jgi:hypothetical protein
MGRCGSKEHLNNKKLLIHASFQSLTGSVLIYVGASLRGRPERSRPECRAERGAHTRRDAPTVSSSAQQTPARLL